MTDIRMAKGYRALTAVTKDSDPISYADIEERIPWRPLPSAWTKNLSINQATVKREVLIIEKINQSKIEGLPVYGFIT